MEREKLYRLLRLGIEKGASKNWSREKREKLTQELPYDIYKEALSIGPDKDLLVTPTAYTGKDLATLIDLIAYAPIVIDGSARLMHTA